MDITEKLEQTHGMFKSRGIGSHAAIMREGIAEIQLLREDNRALKSEVEGLKKEIQSLNDTSKSVDQNKANADIAHPILPDDYETNSKP